MDHYQRARNDLKAWEEQVKANLLRLDSELMHSYVYYFANEPAFLTHLAQFSKEVAEQLEPFVMENNLDSNLPKLEHYTGIGERADHVIHHPSYVAAGDVIYGSGLMSYLKKPGQMLKTLSLFLISSHAGEAGHNCPIACSAGVMRILLNHSDLPEKQVYLEKLAEPSFTHNFTGAQFLTEIQGGSDVGANATHAFLDEEGSWRISGEKWFCSNANADLILLTARYDQAVVGTKGLGLFLVPAKLDNGKNNHYVLRRLKQKIGTRSMATAEINFNQAEAYLIGEAKEGIHLVMKNVLHLSRIFNAFSVLGMSRRAQQIAYYYACHRSAFQHKIINYPLVKETLGLIKAENTAMLASIFAMVALQDECDLDPAPEKELLLRTLANINKYFTAKYSVENIHHCLDILAGNGTIESFSALPRLLRDCIVCENWEGTHFTLWIQTLKDIHKFQIDKLFLNYLNQQLEALDEECYQSLFADKLTAVAEDFKHLKTLLAEEQSLVIKDLIKRMAVLNAGIALALEIHKGQPSSVKKAALALFISQQLTQKDMDYPDYIKRLDEVLEDLPK